MRISDEAREAIERVAAQHGVTVTALIEAWGQALGEGAGKIGQDIVARARALDVARRSRR